MDNLIQNLRINEWDIQRKTIDSLAKIGPRAVEPLIIALKDQNSAVLRHGAAEALGEIKDPRAVEPLIAAALRDDDYRVTWPVAEALGKIKDPRAVESLIVACSNRSSYVRKAAADALVGMANVPSLNAALKNRDTKMIADAYPYFILKGVAGSEDLLIQSLDEYGTRAMAVSFLNSGSTLLAKAATKWAISNGYQIMGDRSGYSGNPRWGGK